MKIRLVLFDKLLPQTNEPKNKAKNTTGKQYLKLYLVEIKTRLYNALKIKKP